MTFYPEQLKPKLLINRYQSAEPDWWHTKIEPNVYWGGEIAAAILTHYLKPQIATIYIKQSPAELVLKNRLKKAPQGDIEILTLFWGFEDNRHPIVPPLLIYADLIASGQMRNIETAKQLYEQEIVGLIDETYY